LCKASSDMLSVKLKLNRVLPAVTLWLLLFPSLAMWPARSAHHLEPASTGHAVKSVDAPKRHVSAVPMSNNLVDKDTWRTVQVFTGQGNDVTPSFRVSGTEWCLVWDIEPAPLPDATFRIHIFQRNKPYFLWHLISAADNGKRVFPIEAENGEEFVFKVFAPYSARWTIIVQDNYLTAPRSAIEISYIYYRGKHYTRDTANCVCYEVIEPDEYVVIRNAGEHPQRMGGWTLTNITKGYPTFTFPADFVLGPGQTVLITTNEVYPDCGSWLEFGTRAPYCGKQLWFSFYFGPGDIWDNRTPNTAVLCDSGGKEVARKSYTVAGD